MQAVRITSPHPHINQVYHRQGFRCGCTSSCLAYLLTSPYVYMIPVAMRISCRRREGQAFRLPLQASNNSEGLDRSGFWPRRRRLRRENVYIVGFTSLKGFPVKTLVVDRRILQTACKFGQLDRCKSFSDWHHVTGVWVGGPNSTFSKNAFWTQYKIGLFLANLVIDSNLPPFKCCWALFTATTLSKTHA